MKTTVDIPEQELIAAMKFSRAKTKREAILTAITEFNTRHRAEGLIKYAGSSKSFVTIDELKKLRRKG
jgi:hypothetical protein